LSLAKDIQKAAGRMLADKRFLWVGQNVTHFFRRCECDVIGINKSEYLIEVEVKISRSDFKADFRKSRWKPMELIVKKGKLNTSSKLLNISRFPNRHYYCCPTGIINVSELPPWSGLIYFDQETQLLNVVKRAPLLHKQKVNLMKSLKYAARRSVRKEFGISF